VSYEGPERRDKHWHLDRKVPIALILALILQTTGAIWWASNQATRLDAVERWQIDNKTTAERLVRVETILERIDRRLAEFRN